MLMTVEISVMQVMQRK